MPKRDDIGTVYASYEDYSEAGTFPALNAPKKGGKNGKGGKRGC
jgi:hypothetical protein